jgi:hypothetical protein
MSGFRGTSDYTDNIKQLDNTINTIAKLLTKSIDEWWSTWHRFAEEDEQPPVSIQLTLEELEKHGYKFDLMTGKWK